MNSQSVKLLENKVWDNFNESNRLLKWVKSGIGRPSDQRKTLESLGLKKLNQTVIHEETPSILGMVRKVSHLITIESKPK